MKFSSIVAMALAPLALASPILSERQSPSAVIAAVGTIQKNIVTLNNTLNTLKPNDILGLAKALQVQQQVGALGDSINAGTKAAQQSPKFSNSESGDVALAVLDLQPQIASLLNNIVTKKPAFATAAFFVGDLTKTVQKNLVQQRAATKAFADALQPKWDAPYDEIAPIVVAEILGYFDTAIDAYQKCTGKVCLPPISIPTGTKKSS